MFEQLDRYLADFIDEEASEDFWYDVAFIEAQELINQFTSEDWKKLFQSLNEKSQLYKIRVAYCIDEDAGLDGFYFLLSLVDEEDEVAEYALDSLRSFTDERYIKTMREQKGVVEKINQLLENASVPVEKILNNLLEQLTNDE